MLKILALAMWHTLNSLSCLKYCSVASSRKITGCTYWLYSYILHIAHKFPGKRWLLTNKMCFPFSFNELHFHISQVVKMEAWQTFPNWIYHKAQVTLLFAQQRLQIKINHKHHQSKTQCQLTFTLASAEIRTPRCINIFSNTHSSVNGN